MIPATTPIQTQTYDQWTPVFMSGERLGPGAFRCTVTLRRSRIVDEETGNTELSPDPDQKVTLVVPDIYAPGYVDEGNPSLGEWWTAEVRAAVIAWAVAGVTAAAAVGTAQGAL